jgi:hypothetical protein
VVAAATSTEAAVIAAAASLLGVLVGGLTSGFLAAKAERRQAKRASRAAWLLLRTELGNALDAVYEIRRTEQWPIGWDRAWSATWRDSRDKLLASPPVDDDLHQVATVCARIDELQHGVNTPRPEDERELSAEDQIFLWRMQPLLERACQALAYRSAEERPSDPTEEQVTEWTKAANARRADDPQDD